MDENKKEIVEGNIGTVGKYDLEFKDGCLCLEVSADYPYGATGVVQKIKARPVLDALKKAIPGVFDDAAIELAAKALGV